MLEICEATNTSSLTMPGTSFVVSFTVLWSASFALRL